MAERVRYSRMGYLTDPVKLDVCAVHLWTESGEDLRRGLVWGARKKWLLAWVDRAMAARLTKRERTCIQMYYFQDLTFREIGERSGTHPSAALRAVQRGLRKLRLEAARDPSWRRCYFGLGRTRFRG